MNQFLWWTRKPAGRAPVAVAALCLLAAAVGLGAAGKADAAGIAGKVDAATVGVPTAAGAAVPRLAVATAPRVFAGGETLRGVVDPAVPGVVVFKGIPYAAPPLGALRWAAPQLPLPRPGEQDATRFAAACFQDSYNTDWYRRVGAAFGAAPGVFSDPPFNEDCLYLNIWVPQTALPATARTATLPAKRPVMVWLHGGSNKGGWSFEPNYDGAKLAAAGPVIVVSVAYRLGVFGFFTPPGLPANISPNFGLQDQLAALRWVQRHIHAFGGDTRRVTLFGESAGARDTGHLMDSPLARGLFHRAIVQSGGFELADRDTPLMRREAGRTFARALSQSAGGLPVNLDSAEALAWAQAQPAAAVFAAAKRALPDQGFNPVTDGTVVVATAASARRGALPYDLLLGFNDNENHMYDRGDQAAFERELRYWPAHVAEPLLALAQQQTDARRGRDIVDTFIYNACPGYLTAAAVARAGRRAWLYRFTRIREGRGGQQLLAYHGAEIPYVFGTHDPWLPTTELDRALTGTMMRYWLNFAATGNPVAPAGAVAAELENAALPAWPAFVGPKPLMQVLGNVVQPEPARDFNLCLDLADGLYPP